jgi:hypothetical protein
VKKAQLKIDDQLIHSIAIGARLSAQQEGELVAFLRENANVFAWDPSKLFGVPLEFSEQMLAVDLDARLVKQNVQHHAHDRHDFITEEVLKLDVAWVICRILYPRGLQTPRFAEA